MPHSETVDELETGPETGPETAAETAERPFLDLARRLIQRRAVPLAAPVALTGTWGALLGVEAEAQSAPPLFDPILVRLVQRVSGSFDIGEYLVAATLAQPGTAQWNPSAYIDYHLDPANVPDADFTSYVAASHPWIQAFTDPTKAATYFFQFGPSWEPLFQQFNLVRQTLSNRRLLERTTEFWSDHFSVDINSKSIAIFKIIEDRDLIRPNALASFGQVLAGSALSPAMRVYLDNAFSSFDPSQPNDGYNENYAREYFELHTLGVGSGYSEADIKAAAAAWAGWTIEYTPGQPNFLESTWNSALHDPNFSSSSNPVTILSGTGAGSAITIPPVDASGGQNQAVAIVLGTHLHPATRRYVGGKLVRFFLRYDIDDPAVAALRTSVEADWLATGGDIRSMLRLILAEAQIQSIEVPTPIRKLKRPAQLATGLMRALRAFVPPGSTPNQGVQFAPMGIGSFPFQDLLDELSALGHAPFAWPPPNGYPDAEGPWLSGLLGRFGLADKLLRNQFTGITIPDSTIDQVFAGTPLGGTGQRMSDVLTGGTMTAFEMQTIESYVTALAPYATTPALTRDLLRQVIALAAATPTYQYH